MIGYFCFVCFYDYGWKDFFVEGFEVFEDLDFVGFDVFGDFFYYFGLGSCVVVDVV